MCIWVLSSDLMHKGERGGGGSSFSRLLVSSFSFSSACLNCKTFSSNFYDFSEEIGNHESSLPLRVSFFLPFFSPFFSSISNNVLFASYSFCYTGGHFLSTRANADVICVRDHYTLSFRGTEKKDTRRDETKKEEAKARGCL